MANFEPSLLVDVLKQHDAKQLLVVAAQGAKREEQRYRLLVQLAAHHSALLAQAEKLEQDETAFALPMNENADYSILKNKNQQLNHCEILLQSKTLDSMPSVLYPDLSSRCNFRCYSCSFHGPQEIIPVPALTITSVEYHQLQTLLPYARNVGIFGSGEPFLSPQLFRLVSDGATYQCIMDIATNGSLLALFQDVTFDSDTFRLVISFDGATAETLQGLRTGARLVEIVKELEALSCCYPDLKIGFNSIVSRGNLDEMADIIDIAIRLRLAFVAFNPLLALPGSSFYEIMALRPADLPLLWEKQQQIKRRLIHHPELSVAFGDIENAVHLEDDKPLDKQGVFQELMALQHQSTKVEVLPLPDPFDQYHDETDTLIALLQCCFSNCERAIITETVVESDLNKEIARLQAIIDSRQPDITNLLHQDRPIKLPYCLAPFKAVVSVVNGETRPCCFFIHNVALGTERTFREIWNGDNYQWLRRAMFHTVDLPQECRSCKDALRYVHVDAFVQYLASIGVPQERVLLPSGYDLPVEWPVLDESTQGPVAQPTQNIIAVMREFGRKSIGRLWRRGTAR